MFSINTWFPNCWANSPASSPPEFYRVPPKANPTGTAYEGELRPAEDVRFLYDKTYQNAQGQRISEHEIFDEVYSVISRSSRFVLLDMFLFNSFRGNQKDLPRPLAEELTRVLETHQAAFSHCEMIFITDPINTVYGAMPSPYLERLRKAGIRVVMTRLDKLRDSNSYYSSAWRRFLAPGNVLSSMRIQNPFDPGEVPVSNILTLANFKANHRKVLIGANDTMLTAIVGSANPHDGSGAHENLAVRFSGKGVLDLLQTERTVLMFSAVEDVRFQGKNYRFSENESLTIRVLTEGAIKKGVLEAISMANADDAIDMAMFYISEREIIHALKMARSRGVIVRLLLDPNKDAFGREKNGIPNRQVAHELVQHGIDVRWCYTQGEQCHSKMLMVRYNNRQGTEASRNTARVILGSANFTRRNIDNFNLETNVEVRGKAVHPELMALQAYFEDRWFNRKDQKSSLDYSSFNDDSRFKYWQYRFMEYSGLSTF